MAERTVAEILRRARELLSDEARWARDTAARNAHGQPVSVGHQDACRFCLMGALAVAVDADIGDAWLLKSFRVADDLLTQVIPSDRATNSPELCPLASFNDDPRTTHADVLAVLDRAIALAEAAP